MNDEVILAEIRELGYPETLTDAEVKAATRGALREIKYEYPVMVLGLFTLRVDQQVYDLFNAVPSAAKSQGVFPEGLRAYELFWTPDGSGDDPDVFGLAPLIQDLSLVSVTSGESGFWTPGDWVIWDQNWAAFTHRFAQGEFEHVDDRNAAPIRVYPVPTCEEQALLRFAKYRTAQEIRDEDESWFLLMVEAFCCRTLARKLSLCAGITFAEAIRDEGKTAAFWEREAMRLKEQAWATFNKRRRDQIHPVQRSGGP